MYWMALYNQRTHKWEDKAFKTLQECRVAGYKNVTTTDAYKIPIRASKTGRKVVAQIEKYGHTPVECTIYDGDYYTMYVIDAKGRLVHKIIRKESNGWPQYIE